MRRKLGRRGAAALAGVVVVAGPVAAACSAGPSYEDWAATDGAAGRINLDEVQKAFKESNSVTEFEKRVNEVYEGDGIVLIRSQQTDGALVLEGYEDLNKNGTIDEAGDDQLFSITKEGEQNEMRGHGANSYYNSSFGGGNFLFTYLLLSSFSRGPYFYSTPSSRIGTIRSDRTRYRNSSGYRTQVSRNSSYFSRQKSFAGSRFTNARVGSNRQSYLNSQRTSGAFRTSGTGVRSSFGGRTSRSSRSSFGGRSSGGRSGGFGGFGGAQTIIGNVREPGQRA